MPEHCSLQWCCIYPGKACWDTWDSQYPSQLVLQLPLCVLQLDFWNIPSLCTSCCIKKIVVFRKTICGSDCSCKIQCHVLTVTSWCQVSTELRDCPDCSSFSLLQNYWRKESIMKWIPALQCNLRPGKHKVMKAGSRHTVGKVYDFLQGTLKSVEIFQ